MLNELYMLSDALGKVGISPKVWDKNLKLLPKVSAKKPCYRIWIAEDGDVESIDVLPADQVSVLRKWEQSNGQSFPGFNIQSLYRIVLDEKVEDQKQHKKNLKAWREGKTDVDIQLLKDWCIEKNNNWDDKIEKKLSKCLGDVPEKISELIGSKENCSSMAILQLMERVLRFPHSGDMPDENHHKKNFRQALETFLWDALEANESVRTALPLLLHEGGVGKDPENDKGKLYVYLDIPDWDEHPVASLKNMEWLNDKLIENVSLEHVSETKDAFGEYFIGGNEKLPSIKLPIIDAVTLRAMNSESPCQYRYHTIDAGSFPVGMESRKRTKGALEWLGDTSREGETWGRADIKELIFAYPSQLPNVSLKLVACLGARKSDDSEERFANASKNVIKGLKGISRDLSSIDLQVFSLKKMDKARTKVVFHRNYTAQRLVEAAEEWETGCANIPDISIRAWGAKKGEWSTVELKTPFPLQIAQCLNLVWKQDGTTECETPIIARTKGIELLLDEQSERFVPHLLTVLLQNGNGLLRSLGNTLNRGEIISIKGYNYQKLLMPPLLGLLLHKLGIGKENYMKKAPFLVGRMLKLADELHALYCKEVRDNNLPPQLIGNTLMTAALDSPAQSLSQLALRLKPYYGWAQTFRWSDSGALAGYFIGLCGEVANDLAAQELPARFNDKERAQLLLGYLAANPKKRNTPSVNPTSDGIDK